MTRLRRLAEDDDLGAQLLRVARGERAPAGSRKRALAVATALGAASGKAAAAPTTLAVVKWIVGAAIVATAVGTAVPRVDTARTPEPGAEMGASAAPSRTERPSTPPTVTVTPPEPSVTASGAPVPPEPRASITAASAPVPPARALTPSHAPTTAPRPDPPRREEPSFALGREIQAIDGAKRALDTSPEHALALLDVYERDFPNRRLGDEATALRIRALLRKGDRAQARLLYDQLEKASPSSLHLQSLRSSF